jgi:hypothetical protein
MIMGSIAIDDVDYDALPKALLAATKAHLRVDFTDDDEYIKDAIKRAISLFERESEISVNPSTYIWKPDPADYCGDVVSIPITPVVDFTALDADDTDVTENYEVASNSMHGVMLYRLVGGYTGGLAVTIESGYATKDELPPGILDIVLLCSCRIYENRGVLMSQSEVADMMRRATSSYWKPRL